MKKYSLMLMLVICLKSLDLKGFSPLNPENDSCPSVLKLLNVPRVNLVKLSFFSLVVFFVFIFEINLEITSI